MNALERKFSNLVTEHKKEFDTLPNYLSAKIRYNDDGTYTNVFFALFPYDVNVEDDDSIFFYTNIDELPKLIANIDFTYEDFDNPNDFYTEVDKYDTKDENNEDYQYLHRGEDFCIVDVIEVFNQF